MAAIQLCDVADAKQHHIAAQFFLQQTERPLNTGLTARCHINTVGRPCRQ